MLAIGDDYGESRTERDGASFVVNDGGISNAVLNAALIPDKAGRVRGMEEALSIPGIDAPKRVEAGLGYLVNCMLRVKTWESFGPVGIDNVGKISDAIVDIASEGGIPEGLLLRLLEWTNTDHTLALRIDTVRRILENKPEIPNDEAVAFLLRNRAVELVQNQAETDQNLSAIGLLGILGGKESVQVLAETLDAIQRSAMRGHSKLLEPTLQSLAKIWKGDPETALLALAKASRNFEEKSPERTLINQIMTEIINSQEGTIFQSGRATRKQLRQQLKGQGVDWDDRVGISVVSSAINWYNGRDQRDSREMLRTAIHFMSIESLSIPMGTKVVTAAFRTRVGV